MSSSRRGAYTPPDEAPKRCIHGYTWAGHTYHDALGWVEHCWGPFVYPRERPVARGESGASDA